ncbi:MFS transporter [Streptomyces sp. TRM66268-LWL]|uniref:MFS transporter n=1 Tax=Streptomyces polyasparticus TaxID=2767826 RepID=A0ABR7S912_9ACTN|nr:MFS transporter [Streptomyces polyasparticus]MBC9711976.1 MFS transporter [Streptomyces polyasparticus]
MTAVEAVGVQVPTWRGGFGRLWAAAVLSKFGDSLRTAALPLLAASLTDDPLLITLVSACGYLPWLLFGLLGGAVADRVDQRRAMWAVDVVRGVLMAAFALAVALGHASIALLIALAFLLTTLQTLFDNAATALLPSLVPESALGSANARLMTGQQIAGGFVAAPLVPVLLAGGIALPYGVDAATYVVGACLIASLRIPAPERAPRPPGATLRGDIAEGVRVLWRDRPLRALCWATTLSNIGMGALIATLVLHVKWWLDAGDVGYAAALTAFSAGSVAGGFVAGRLAGKLGRLRSVFVAGVVQLLCLLAMGLVKALWAALVSLALFGVMSIVWNVSQRTLMQERSPREMLGRISAAYRTLAVAGAPLGALLGGAVATAWGLNAPVLLAAGVFVAAVAVLVPVRRVDGPRGDI